MFKIDKSMVDNMNQNRSFIVITHKETHRDTAPEISAGGPELLEKDEQLPQALRDRARELMQSAQKRAQQTIQAATARAEEIKAQAKKEGYDAGMKLADSKIAEMEAALSAQTRKLLEEVTAYRNELYDALQDSVLNLAMDIAEKILNVELQRDDKVYMEIAKKAVAGLKQADDFTLRVSRGEFDKYFRDGGAWLREATGCGEFEAVCDPNLEPGSLVLESDEEIINASVAVQLEKTRQYLEEQVE
ncbi:MAG: FliH/SctL family protein [Christensenellales bacterium]